MDEDDAPFLQGEAATIAEGGKRCEASGDGGLPGRRRTRDDLNRNLNDPVPGPRPLDAETASWENGSEDAQMIAGRRDDDPRHTGLGQTPSSPHDQGRAAEFDQGLRAPSPQARP